MIKYYNSLSWRLGTRLKTREPDASQFGSTFEKKPLKAWLVQLCLFVAVLFSTNMTAQFTFTQNFETDNGSFTGDFSRFTGATACSGSGGAMRANLWSSGQTRQLVSPSVGTSASGSTTISFDYKIANWSANTVGTSGNWGSFLVQYGSSASGPWTTVLTVNQANHVVSGNCATLVTPSFNPPAGPLFVRFSASYGSAGDYYLNFDNITVDQAAPPSCTGTPDPGSVSISNASGCDGQNLVLSTSGLSFGLGITYQWQSSPDDSVWTDIPGQNATSYTTTSTLGLTYYRIVTTCSGSGESNQSPSVSFDGVSCGSVNLPASGSNTVTCGTNTLIYDNGGSAGDYSANSNGFIVLQNSGTGIITLSGSVLGIESCCDDINIFSGVGTGGTLLANISTAGAISTITSAPGEAITIQLVSDGSVQGAGFAFQAIYSGACATCEGIPVPGATIASSSFVCDANSVLLSLENTELGAGITYQWQSSLDDSNWTDILGAESATYTATPTENTFYRCNVTCSGDTGASSSVEVAYFTAPAFCAAYCDPVYTSGKTDGDLISNISILGTTLSNNTGADPVNPAYTFYFGAPNLTAELQAGAVYTVSVTVGTFGSQNLAAWIDYNDDGVFDASERIGFTTSSIAANGTANFNITLSCNPPLGEHRLRVRDVWNLTGSSIDPCTSYGFGETEDYIVTITSADPCPVPKNLTAANGTPTSGDLSWDVGCEEEAWEVVVQLQGLGIPAGSGTPVTETTFSVSDLTPGVYEYYVRANCVVNGFSSWAGPYIFTPPGCTSNISPADLAEDVVVTGGEILFSWNAFPDATGYDFWFGTSLGNLTNLGTSPTSTITITGIQKQTQYFWYVVPVNANGTAIGCDSTVTSFTTEDAEVGDICLTAISLDLLTSPITGDTSNPLLSNASNPACGTNTAGDLFYSITVPDGYTLEIGQTENDYDSRNFVYFGDCSSGTQIACYDEPDTNVVSWLNNTGVTQTVYWIQDGFSSGVGTFTLAWDLIPPPIVITEFAPTTFCSIELEEEVAEINVVGSNFTNINSVTVGGVAALFNVIDDTQLTVSLTSAHLLGGEIQLTNPETFVVSSTVVEVFTTPDVDPITAPGSATALCMPNTLVLSSLFPGGTWSSSDDGIATVVGGTVTGVSEGTVTISYSVTDNGCTTVVTYDVDIYDPVVINSFTPSQTIVTGNDATFSVAATGSGLTYQWFAFDGSDSYPIDDVFTFAGEVYSGFNSDTLLISGVPGDINGLQVFCTVSGTSPCSPETTTPNSILNVGDTGIGSDPADVTLCDGGSTTFTVVRSGDDLEESISYAWEYDADGTDNWQPVADGNLDGMTIADSDSDVLSVSTITLIHNGYRFRAVVTGPANAATSNPASLSINEGVSISAQPTSALVCRIATSANFSVTAGGDVTGIQWQSSPNGVDTWSNVGTGTSLNVAVTPATPVGVTYYRAVVSGNAPCVPVNSDVVTLTVQQPTISVTPSSATYCFPGDAVSLTASGADTYTWSPATGLSATTGATVSASPTVTTTYTVTGTDANGCSNTTTVTVSVSSQISGDATADLTEVCANDPVQLGITPAQVSPSYPINSASYRFEATSGTFTPLVGGTSSGLSATADDSNSGSLPIGFSFNYGGTNYSNFRVNSNGLMVFNATGSTTGFNSLATTTASQRTSLAPLWDDLQCTSGVTYQVSGTAPNRVLTVEWLNMEWNWSSTVGISFQVKLYEGTNIIEYVYRPEAAGNPTGSSGASIGLMGTASGNYISLSDSGAAPSISTTTPTNNIGVKPASGQIYRFIPSAPVTYTYAWSSTPSGFSSTDQNPVVNPSETTTYSVVVTSSAGCTHTSEVTVNVVSGAVIDTQPVALEQCEGTDASFTVAATGPSLSYQWRKDGVAIDGATAATLDLTAISASDDAAYDVVITPLCGDAVTSDAVTLTVNLLPISTASNSGVVCEGGAITLSATSDIAGSTFLWSGPNGFSSTDQNPVLSDVTMANVGEYTVTVTSPALCSSTTSTTVSINPNAPLEISVSGSATTACVGELKTLTASANSVGSVSVSFGTNLESIGVTGGNVFPATISGIPVGAVVTSAELQFTNVNSINGSFRSEIRVALSGAYVLGATQISTLTSSGLITPDPTVNVPGFTATSGAINLVLTESFNDGGDGVGVDATFGTAVLVINYALPTPAVTWSPTTDLFTDAEGTVPYDGGDAATVYALVTGAGPTSYTASSVNVLGCVSEATYSFGITTTGCPSTTVVQTSQCGATLPAIDSNVFANLVSGAQGYRFRVTNMSTNEVQTIDRALRVFRITQLTNFAFNTTYMVEVAVRRNNVWEAFYGTGCTVTTPDTTTQIQASQCNTTIANVNNAIFADIVPFATGYRFRVTNTLNPIDVQTVDRPLRDFRMTNLASFEYNTTYNVEVAVRNTDGTYLSYGPVCNITTPLFPTVGLVDTQCDEYVVSSNSETLLAESYPGAEGYRFLLENLSQPYSQTTDRATRTVTLNNFTGLLPGTTYTVRVAIQLNGVWGPYGKSCSIITPGAGRPDEVTRVDEGVVNEFKAIAYPNPFATSFAIDVRTSNTETVSLTVYDMAGRLLEVREVKAQDVTNYQFGDRYPSGVYNVIVTQGNETRTVRVVKQ